MAAFNPATLVELNLGHLTLEEIEREAALAIPGDSGAFVAYYVDLAAASGGAAIDDIVATPGAGRSLFIVSLAIGPRLGSASNIGFQPVYGSAYGSALPGLNGAGGGQNSPGWAPARIMTKLAADSKFGLKNMHASAAALHGALCRFCVVKA